MGTRSAFIILSFFLVLSVRGQVRDKDIAAKDTGIAAKLVSQSINAMGGDAWNSVHSLLLEGYGNWQTINQSERPEGPFIPEQRKNTVLKDILHERAIWTNNALSYTFESASTYIMDGPYIALKSNGRLVPIPQDQSIQDDLSLAPEAILTKALRANDLQYLKDTVVQQA